MLRLRRHQGPRRRWPTACGCWRDRSTPCRRSRRIAAPRRCRRGRCLRRPRSRISPSVSISGEFMSRTRSDFFRCTPLVQVGTVEKREELGMREVVLPGEFRQPADRLRRRHVDQVQLLFRLADVGVGLLQHRQEQVVLAGEVVVDEPLVDVRRARRSGRREAPARPCRADSSQAARRMAAWERSASRPRGSAAAVEVEGMG